MVLEKIKVLDHGYVAFVEHWGSDASIIEAARMSTDKGFLGWGRNECRFCGLTKQEFDSGYINVQTCADDGHVFVDTQGVTSCDIKGSAAISVNADTKHVLSRSTVLAATNNKDILAIALDPFGV